MATLALRGTEGNSITYITLPIALDAAIAVKKLSHFPAWHRPVSIRCSTSGETHTPDPISETNLMARVQCELVIMAVQKQGKVYL